MTHGNKAAVARLSAGPSSNIADFGISAAVCDSYMVPTGHRYVGTRALRERATRRAHVIEAATVWRRGPAPVGRVVARFSPPDPKLPNPSRRCPQLRMGLADIANG
jgi:hypothetical protein